ncbi:hypothetical protein K3495_g6080 [Podosphaera aphanis]|nr:hypothetical protein K3495_g6080 [Podosphaera aphanis]
MEFNNESELKSDSEAETIVLHQLDRSTSEIRNFVKLEHGSGDDSMRDAPNIQVVDKALKRESVPSEAHENKGTASSLGKRKRPKNKHPVDNSSAAGEVTTSQGAKNHQRQKNAISSDSETSRSPSPRHESCLTTQAKARSLDRALSHRNTKNHSRITHDTDKVEELSGKQQSTDCNLTSLRHNDPSSGFETDTALPIKPPRSVSPNHSIYKRGPTTQLSTKSCRSLSQKKKRVPAPLQPAEFNYSDDSSTSANSRPQSSRSRNMTLPTTRDSSTLSARLPPHKKHVNSSGQTPLAVACARGKLELVKRRYAECPEDLNVPDNALNTPLHIASLEGLTSIVKFLLDTGNCELDCVNTVKDTPLHDAIDNKNIEVVRLLLNAGANPCKPNQAGSDPLDLLNQQDNLKDKETLNLVSEMKKAVISAKEKFTAEGTRRTQEDQIIDDTGKTSSNTKYGPRHIHSLSHKNAFNFGSTNRKVGTARSLMKTTERVLYQTFDLDALRVAARDGDIATVSRVLDVRPSLNDPLTLFNAAKGGHDAVINILFALGDFDPDPNPMAGLPIEYSTPILAAIGRDHHLEVVKLFLGNSRFNPTRRIKGEKYLDIARRRGGQKWKEEVQILMKASQAYEKNHRTSHRVSESPESVRDRSGSDHDSGKSRREDQRVSRWERNLLAGSKLRNGGLIKAPSEKSDSSSHIQEMHNQMKVVHRGIKAESGISALLSDIEPHPIHFKASPDRSTVSENEPALKPRRKLVSGRELKDGRALEKRRRKSIASTPSGNSEAPVVDKRGRVSSNPNSDKIASSLTLKDVSTFKESKNSQAQREPILDWHHPRNDVSKNVSRNSPTDRRYAIQREIHEKRRRKSEASSTSKFSEFKSIDECSAGTYKKKRRIGDSSVSLGKSEVEFSSEDIATLISNNSHEISTKKYVSSNSSGSIETGNPKKDKWCRSSKGRNCCGNSPLDPSNQIPITEDNIKKPASGDHISSNRCLPEVLQSMKRQSIKHKNEAVHQSPNKLAEQKPDEALQKHKGEGLQCQKKQCLNIDHLSPDIVTNLNAASKERLPIENRKAEISVQKDKYWNKETILQETEPATHIQLKKEKDQQNSMLPNLPILLRWFQQMPEPKKTEIAELFRCIVGYRYDTINDEATGQKGGDDQWMLSTHAAILLGEKDLQLSQYTTWEREALTVPQKKGVWSTCKGFFLLLDGNLPSLREQLPHETQPMEEAIENNKKQFLGLDLFFLKVTEFMCVVPKFPHLKGIEMVVVYRELRIPQSAPHCKMKWKQDPLCSPGQKLAPLPKHFVDGVFICETQDSTTTIVREPPSPDTYPRRFGLIRVYPGDPDYEEICRNLRSRDKIAGRGSALKIRDNPALVETKSSIFTATSTLTQKNQVCDSIWTLASSGFCE